MGIGFGIFLAGVFLGSMWREAKKTEGVDPIDRLERLKQLHEVGTIDDDEFQDVRKRLIKTLKRQNITYF